jgi:protein required for attachment to host cells
MKNQYTKAKKEYQAAIKGEKMRSWKQCGTATSPNNPWNEIYKLANNKTRSKQFITTMRKPDGTKTETMAETIQLIMDQLILEDKHKEDTPYHRTIRDQTKQPLYTMDYKEFTKEEVKQVIESLQPKKAPGPNGITNEIIKRVFKEIPKTMTATYNACLRTGRFPVN